MIYGPKHSVVASGLLARIVGAGEFMVNSRHGQCIDRPAAGLVVEARAPDGTVEAVSYPSAPGFVLGVQWHPEWCFSEIPANLALFEAFGDACRAYAGKLGKGA